MTRRRRGSEKRVGYATLLLEQYKSAAPSTRQIILSALAKIAMHANSDAPLRARLGELFRANAVHEVVELQQRSAVEYFVMTSVGANASRLKSVLDPMPGTRSALEKTVEENVGETADAAAARKARTQGGALPVTTPTRSAEEPTTPYGGAGAHGGTRGSPRRSARPWASRQISARRKKRRTTPRSRGRVG